MNKLYEVNINKNLNDIKLIDEKEYKISLVYFLLEKDKEIENEEYKFSKLPKEKIKTDGEITFVINCEQIKNYKKQYLKKIKKIKMKNQPKTVQILILKYNSNEEGCIIDLIQSIKIQLLESIERKYDYIYDSVCNFLDNKFICDNICDFKNNRCVAKRDYNLTCGCCRHYKSFISTKLVQCEHLKDKKCSAHCITCKLFTCDYIVRNKGIKFKIRDIFLLKNYLNPIQKLIILTSYFTTKERIMKRLLKCSLTINS